MSKKYCLGLIGFPVIHSLSPKLHRAALDAAGLDGEYRLYPIAPVENGELWELKELSKLLERVREGELHGMNVTIPHKQTVIPYLDELTPTAQAIGAVNTIYFRDNKLLGDNTDAPAFLADLKQFLASVQFSVFSKNVLVLGAGGAARAVVYALLQEGWHIALAARRPEQAQALINDISRFTHHDSTIQRFGDLAIQRFNDSTDHHLPITNHRSPISNFQSPISLMINTTPLGMTPNLGTSPWPADLPFPENAAVYDLVYNPCETKFVRDARAAGLPATTGLGMLIEQAALAFEIWTGMRADREAMCEAVR